MSHTGLNIFYYNYNQCVFLRNKFWSKNIICKYIFLFSGGHWGCSSKNMSAKQNPVYSWFNQPIIIYFIDRVLNFIILLRFLKNPIIELQIYKIKMIMPYTYKLQLFIWQIPKWIVSGKNNPGWWKPTNLSNVCSAINVLLFSPYYI